MARFKARVLAVLAAIPEGRVTTYGTIARHLHVTARHEDNASRAAKRIARLLGATKAECGSIRNEFFNNNCEWLSKTRNGIAHGDTGLSLATVAGQYPSLYRHVTAAIVKLLNLPPGSVDDTKDYYDEISRLTDARFFNLPNS